MAKASKTTKKRATKLGIRVTIGKKQTPKTEARLKREIKKKSAVKMGKQKRATARRKPKSTGQIHACAVNLGRRGGKAKARNERKAKARR